MIITEPVSGTRDFLPKDMKLRTWLFDKFKNTARIYGFEEYDAPILEPEELYKRKAGEEITEQMYNFVDKSGLAVALRPEMTPSLARLVLKAGKSIILPIKWFSIPQCWRYETCTKGRKREHYQWNMDIWGVQNVTAEAELLSSICYFFKSVGFTSKEIGIKVNSRKILQGVLEAFNIKGKDFEKCCVIVDKLDKLKEEEVLKYLKENTKLTEENAKKLLKIMTNRSIESLEKDLNELLPESKKIEKAKKEFLKDIKDLFALLKSYGISDWVIYDASIVRGLSYYTGVVFEAFARRSKLQRAICGGGRYDKILKTYGANKPIPACGFGFGDCVILELLKEYKKLPNLSARVDDVVVPFNEKLRCAATEVATLLRSSGRSVDILLKKMKKISASYSYADRVGASRVILIAPSEWEKKLVRIKYLRESAGFAKKDDKKKEEKSKNEYDVPLDKLTTFKRE